MVSMLNRKSKIIKKHQTAASGSICLGAGSPVAPVRNSASSAPVSTAQATVIENTESYVVIELTCSCGDKIKLKCNYADLAI